MKKNKMTKKLSIKFMCLIALIIILNSFLFTILLSGSVQKKQKQTLKNSIDEIVPYLINNKINELDFIKLPYYITYVVYVNENKNIIHTNDSLLPIIKNKQNKAKKHFIKNYYIDGDLDILFLTKDIIIDNTKYTIQCAMDITNDSAYKMVQEFPKIILLSIIPIFLISYFISLLITKKTVSQFVKLENKYEKEKNFSANLSHELKTPISIIDGHANLIKRWGKNDKEQLNKSIDIILQETNNMTLIISNLIKISKAESSQLNTTYENINIYNFFNQQKSYYCKICNDIKFVINTDPNLILKCDINIITEVFSIIINNSIKYCNTSPQITLQAFKLHNKIHLICTDNGNGFSEESLIHIFDRFYKEDKSHNRNQNSFFSTTGSGLGLSIAKVLTEYVNGKILAYNNKNHNAVIELVFDEN